MVNVKVERILIKFTKNNGAKFISHLDTVRTLHRAFRRAELPISYSKGFNPHASISVASPLSLGIESNSEYADVEINETVPVNIIAEALNSVLPNDIKIVKVVKINGKMPASMAVVASTRYSIRFEKETTEELAAGLIKEILTQDEIMRMKRSKSGEKLTNIRPFIKDLTYEKFDDGHIKFDCILQSGSNGSLGAEILATIIKEYSKGEIYGHPYITREEIYTQINDKRIALDRYFAGM
jgi:radical SAM-linked protein